MLNQQRIHNIFFHVFSMYLFRTHFIPAGEAGSADTVRDPRGFALKFYTEEGNWDLTGNNTPIFFIRDAMLVSWDRMTTNRFQSLTACLSAWIKHENQLLTCALDSVQFPSFIHSQKRNPQTHLKDPDMVWDFWSLRPESLHQVAAVVLLLNSNWLWKQDRTYHFLSFVSLCTLCRCLFCSAIEVCPMATVTWMVTALTPSNLSMLMESASTASSTTKSVWGLTLVHFRDTPPVTVTLLN